MFNLRFLVWSLVISVLFYALFYFFANLAHLEHLFLKYWYLIVPGVLLVSYFIFGMVQESRKKLGLNRKPLRRSPDDYPRV